MKCIISWQSWLKSRTTPFHPFFKKFWKWESRNQKLHLKLCFIHFHFESLSQYLAATSEHLMLYISLMNKPIGFDIFINVFFAHFKNNIFEGFLHSAQSFNNFITFFVANFQKKISVKFYPFSPKLARIPFAGCSFFAKLV